MRETLITAVGRRDDLRPRVDASHVVDGFRTRSRDRRARLSSERARALPVAPVPEGREPLAC